VSFNLLTALISCLVVDHRVVHDIVLAEYDGVVVEQSDVGDARIGLKVVRAIHTLALALEHKVALLHEDPLEQHVKQVLVHFMSLMHAVRL